MFARTAFSATFLHTRKANTMSKKSITVGNIKIGGGAAVSVQSMTNTNTADPKKTIAQINALAQAGCQIVRLAVPNSESARAIYQIKSQTSLPIVADIHFDHRLALLALDAGVDKIRINPGNIGDSGRVRQVVDSCRAKNVPIRIGVNGGSLEKDILAKHGHPTPQALVESALGHVEILHRLDFDQICISIKSSDVRTTVDAYRLLAQTVDYPLHLGVTETGVPEHGIVKSTVGIGSLLYLGIGDTIRVSLTDDPVREVAVGRSILKSLGLATGGIDIISCPTCGRCKLDIIGLVKQAGQRFSNIDKPLKVAIMGCVVNGPGEAKEADFGIAGGETDAILFEKGQIVGRVDYENILNALEEKIMNS